MEPSSRPMFVLLIIQFILVLLSILFLRYDKELDAKTPDRERVKDAMSKKYSIFQNVQVMIFVGFGFLMTFLKKYSFSSIGFSFLLTAVIVQWSLFCHGIAHIDPDDFKIRIDIESLLNADISSAAALISMGAVLGCTTPMQLVIMGLIETVLFSINENITKYLDVTDVGGSMVVHVFGAYFGLAVSKILGPPKGEKHSETSSYTSDMFAMIGTIYLWVFWPSFNGALATNDELHRAVVNTYLSLAACCVTAFALSALLSEHKKYDMVHIQNATLAGGVAIGTSADLMTQPFGALIVGCIAAVISVTGYVYLTPFLLKRYAIHDTCGVHNLHGMPGVFAGIVGALMSWLATLSQYGYSLYLQFPARAPYAHTEELAYAQQEIDVIKPGDGRSGLDQAFYQLLALVISILISLVGGSITGLILKAPIIISVPEDSKFQDKVHWELPELENAIQPKLEFEFIDSKTAEEEKRY